MIKKNVLTATGVILSFAIAIGGWLVTSWLMDTQSDRLLYGTTSFVADVPATNLAHNNSDPLARLTKYEMFSVLTNWESNWTSGTPRRLHEPALGQINMEQAITSGREGIDFLYENNILPQELLTFANARAYLMQNVSDDEDLLPTMYSFWEVRFTSDHLEIQMTINAVTGQIWAMRINVLLLMRAGYLSQIALGISHDDIKGALPAFMSKLELDFDADALGTMEIAPYGYLIAPLLSPAVPAYVDGLEYIHAAMIGHQIETAISYSNDLFAMVFVRGTPVSEEKLYFSHLFIQLFPTREFIIDN